MASFEPMENRCGTCTLCVDSCPTGALERPFYLDASKCLSYLSIEDKGKIDEETGTRMGDCFFGCDRCQEACPLNGKEDSTQIFLPSTDTFLEMDDNEFKKRFGKRLSFWGGVDDQKVIPFGTPADVEGEVRLRLEQLAPGGGYILCSAHNVQATTPLDNVHAFYNASERFRSYPINV